jgi:PPK2 family polyphosphate:nucleotide phosphotransferase
LWRIHKAVPPAGAIGIFNRSQYEDVLIVRVDQLVPEKVWRERYDQINDFERYLTQNGTTILKFFLNISKAEQKKRFQSRLDDEEKQWKFSVEDLNKREQWDDYQKAYEELLNRCTTEWAPWYAIPADQKWYRNYAVIRTIVETMRDMKFKRPKPVEGMDKIKIE